MKRQHDVFSTIFERRVLDFFYFERTEHFRARLQPKGLFPPVALQAVQLINLTLFCRKDDKDRDLSLMSTFPLVKESEGSSSGTRQKVAQPLWCLITGWLASVPNVSDTDRDRPAGVTKY